MACCRSRLGSGPLLFSCSAWSARARSGTVKDSRTPSARSSGAYFSVGLISVLRW